MNTATKQLFDVMVRHGIGLDPWFFERTAEAPNFPPHNIIQRSEDEYRLTLAVAGFSDAELDITMHNDVLTVTGQKEAVAPDEATRVLYNGIAFRDFSRQFKLGEHVHVETAVLQDGLLQIDLVRRVPEAMKPRKILLGATTAQQRAVLAA